ncbi:MAG: nucleotidyl transferase AbiEii/AbiGii toxin family protein [Candidatus Omnitrophica bacterium]|nr:nucleotidyl transferase AbiEii/AbiGii toxin family protein [Candidatus Omnitrophota bacterium]
MSEQIIAILKRKLDDFTARDGMNAETLRNALKEELQFYVLNFIYHHPEYSKWIMYGGSALRVIHGLNRMSVDLDFEVYEMVTKDFLEELKKEIEDHFSRTYSTHSGFMTVKIVTGRGLLLKFNAGAALDLGHPSNQVHVKIDLNHFSAPKTVPERYPVNRDQLSFVIVTYNMSTLMASKVAAIFLRGTRGVGKAFYEEKGRDIYDLIWYMEKKIVPDLDYLIAKNVKEAKDLRTLFDKLTVKMNAVSGANLKQDLLPLFVNRTYIENWLTNWKESYLRLLDAYKICTVTTLESVRVRQHFDTDNFSFIFTYNTEEEDEGKACQIRYAVSEYWINFQEGNLTIEINRNIDKIIKITRDGVSTQSLPEDKLKQYAALFYQKTENYLKKTNRIMLGRSIDTKLIRMTAEHLNQKEQIILNKSALLSCELEDLLK